MKIEDFIWLDEIVEKLADKHHVSPNEVIEIFESLPFIRYISKGRCNLNENVYVAYGQASDGRYLVIFFIHKPGNLALIISARDMDKSERKSYGKEKS